MAYQALSENYKTDFEKILDTERGLAWLPWVGVNYPALPHGHRLLIVGESCYYWEEADRIGKWKKPTQTYDIIAEAGIGHAVHSGWGHAGKTIDNVHPVILGSRSIDRERFWSDVSFYNFVQRPMRYGKKPERPSGNDWMTGWKVFIDVCRIVEPSHCIFVGVEAAGRFNEAMKSEGVKFFQPIAKSTKITGDFGRGCYGRTAKIDLDGRSIELNFVLHTSRMKNYEAWRTFLKTNSPDIMGVLEGRGYQNSKA